MPRIIFAAAIAFFLCSCFMLNTETPELHKAAAAGNTIKVKAILNESPSEIDNRDRWGSTPLMYAASNAQVPTVRLLLDEGANPNARDRKGISIVNITNSDVFNCKNRDKLVLDMKARGKSEEDIEKFSRRYSDENLEKWREIAALIYSYRAKENLLPTISCFIKTTGIYTLGGAGETVSLDESKKQKYLSENLKWKVLGKDSLLQWKYFAQYLIFPGKSELHIETSMDFYDEYKKLEILEAVRETCSNRNAPVMHRATLKGNILEESFSAPLSCILLIRRKIPGAETIVTSVKGEIMASGTKVSQKNSPEIQAELFDFYEPEVMLINIDVKTGSETIECSGQ